MSGPTPSRGHHPRFAGRHAAAASGSRLLGFIAIVMASINLVGGFVVTDRMLKMFKQ